jgi:tripartite-type tricarboxylate transporter receptor subunit TctC
MNSKLESGIAGLVLFVAVSSGMAGGAFAQSYPNKPMRFVVAMSPGGVTDILARIVGQKLTESWGQAVVIDNRPGASGMLGSEYTAKAPPDGYTIQMAQISTHAINLSLFSKVPYDPVKDFAPVTQIAALTGWLVVHPSFPANSVQELIALAKAKPGEINFATGGIGTTLHLAGELLKTMAGIDIVHVAYSGAKFLPAVIGGEIPIALDNMPSSIAFVKSGKLKALAVITSKRSPTMPELPTIAESGVPGFEVASWIGVVAPAKTPRDIVNKLHAEIIRILRMPDVQQRFFELGADPVGNTPEQFGAYIQAEIVKWAKVVKDSGAHAN